jgi:hypothetical protein
MTKNITTITIVALILAGALAGMTSLARPEVISANSPETEFSAERAMQHVSAISGAPHPPGSEEIEKVRAYLIAELQTMGLSPEVQDTSIAVLKGSTVYATSVKNIIVVIPGTDSTKAVLLDGHYDTREMTPGASDCGSCVATALETARAILAGPPLKNNVIVLLTDNEEYGGGLGAAAFVDRHPLADEVGMVLNFEALGSTGPSRLFQTGPNSGWAVREVGKVTSHPVGQSWFYEIFRLTPIGTDLTWFNKAGIPGLDFGYWAKGTDYHTMRDNPETIDLRSLQHHGSYALALTQHFGNQDLNAASANKGDAVYFSLFYKVFVSYPTAWALPLALLTGLILVIVAVSGIRREQITIHGTLKGLGGFLLSMLVSGGVATGIWFGVAQLHSEYQAMLTYRGLLYNAQFYFYAFTALAIAIAASILAWLRRKTSVIDLHFGALVFIWLFAISTSILLPGFSYLTTWPLLFSALALGWVLKSKSSGDNTAQTDILLTIGALPSVILFTPFLYVLYNFALAPMIGTLGLFVSMLLGFLIPQLDLFTRTHKWRLTWVMVLICIVFLVIGSLTAGFDTDNPRPNEVAYFLDADSGVATWFSGGPIQDDWTKQFFSTEPERGTVGELFPIAQRSGFPIIKAEAPKIALDAPVVEVLSDQNTGSVRTLQLNLSSPRGAPIIMLDVEPYESVQAVIFDGKRIESIESEINAWNLTYYAVPQDGFEITLELDPLQAINLQISDQTWELAPEVLDQLGLVIQPRSKDMMPMPNFDYGTVVVTTLNFD